MALPPTIPTSFVPKQPLQQAVPPRRQKSGVNILMLAGVAVFSVAVIASGALFGLQYYLTTTRDAKLQELTRAQEAVNVAEIEEFIRLKGRLSNVKPLLDQHVRVLSFFSVLEANTLESVRFGTLTLTVNEDRTAEIRLTGTARSFNALAAQSTHLTTEKRIRRAIFSDISPNDSGQVGFNLTASISPDLVLGTQNAAATTSEPTVPPAVEQTSTTESTVPPVTQTTQPTTPAQTTTTVPPSETSTATVTPTTGL